jgi:hypothetical protein
MSPGFFFLENMIKAFPPSIFSSMHITRNAIEIRGEEGEEKKTPTELLAPGRPIRALASDGS